MKLTGSNAHAYLGFYSSNEAIETVAQIKALEGTQLYKTSASFEMEQGVVDIGQDSDPGAKMLDGIVNISGSISGLFEYDEATGNFNNVTADVLNLFLPYTDGNELKRNNQKVFLKILLNSNAKDGQHENWLFVPIVISSLGLTLDNAEAQSREIAWSKGEGQAIRISWTPRFFSSVNTLIQNFAPSFSAIQNPNTSFWPSKLTATAV